MGNYIAVLLTKMGKARGGIGMWEKIRSSSFDMLKIIFTQMFMATLIIIAKYSKQPRSPSTDEWIKKTMVYP